MKDSSSFKVFKLNSTLCTSTQCDFSPEIYLTLGIYHWDVIQVYKLDIWTLIPIEKGPMHCPTWCSDFLKFQVLKSLSWNHT
jgi:hypothetical protein